MRCPACNAPTRVMETRAAEDRAALRRRRACTQCEHRFTTFERREPEALFVRKRSGERQRFDSVKLRASLLRAAHKRPVSAADVEGIVERIAAAAREDGNELSADRISELSLSGLRELDLGAYLQFAGTLPEPAPEVAASAAGSVRPASEDRRSTQKGRPKESQR